MGRALAAAPYVGDEADGRIFVRTRLYTTLELGVVDEAAEQWFEANNFLLVWEMHQLSGRPMAFVVPADYDEFRNLGLLATFIDLSDGSWLDIHGKRDSQSVLGEMSWVAHGGISYARWHLEDPVQMNLLLDALAQLPGVDVETKLATAYSELEREVARAFARHVLERAGVPTRPHGSTDDPFLSDQALRHGLDRNRIGYTSVLNVVPGDLLLDRDGVREPMLVESVQTFGPGEIILHGKNRFFARSGPEIVAVCFGSER